jgi:hypothetical protein
MLVVVLVLKQTYAGGGASISAASNQPVCSHFSGFLVQITSNKAKNQCRNMGQSLQ